MNLGIWFIMITQLFQAASFYTFMVTQKSWLQNQGYSNASSSSLNQVFSLVTYASCFFGGWLAETSFGRYRTLLTMAVVSFVGSFLASMATHTDVQSVGLYGVGTFVFIAIGTGGLRPSLCAFGADQIDPTLPDADKQKESFFMYVFVMVNVGAFVAVGFLASVATNGLPGFIPADEGFFAAYMTASCLMAIAMLCYLGGTPWYRKESFATNSTSVLRPCLARLWGGRSQPLGKAAILGWVSLPLLIIVSISQALLESEVLAMVNLVLTVICIVCLVAAHRDNRWLGRADAMTRCLDAVPVLLVGNLTFNVMYNTMSSTFYSEACQMDTRIGSGANAMQLNGAFFTLGDVIAVIAFTPLIDGVLVPGAERLLGRRVSFDVKIITGIVIAMGSQALAALLEHLRQQAPVLDIGSKCAPLQPDGLHVQMSDFSAFWMFVPYAMLGVGAILVFPVLSHVAYEGTDPFMRSLMQGFNFFAMGGLPNAVSAAMTQATASLTPNDLNEGNLPMAYLTNIAFCLIGCVIYVCLSRNRTPVDPQGAKDLEGPEASPRPALLTAKGRLAGQVADQKPAVQTDQSPEPLPNSETADEGAEARC